MIRRIRRLQAILLITLSTPLIAQEADFQTLRHEALNIIALERSNNFVKMYAALNSGVKNWISLEKFVQLMSSPPRTISGDYRPVSTQISRGIPELGYVVMESPSDSPPIILLMIKEDGAWKLLSFPQGRAGRILDTYIQKKIRP